VQPGEAFWGSCSKTLLKRETSATNQRIKSRASCSVRRGGALRHSAQHSDLVSLIYIQACGGLRAGERPGVSHCTEFAPNDQRISAFFCVWSDALRRRSSFGYNRPDEVIERCRLSREDVDLSSEPTRVDGLKQNFSQAAVLAAELGGALIAHKPPALPASRLWLSISCRASCRRNCFWNCNGLMPVMARKCCRKVDGLMFVRSARSSTCSRLFGAPPQRDIRRMRLSQTSSRQ
jgi:hypothetical protein